MKNESSQQERNFFHRLNGDNSVIKIALIAIFALMIFGLVIDAFNGFYILRNAKSSGWGIVGLIVLAIFYFIGEACSDWISSKDTVTHPLYKRSLHLLLLLCFAAAVGIICWFVFKKLGW
jgi:amino acid transporter